MHRMFMIGAVAMLLIAVSARAADTWPMFRGDGTSLTEARELPLQWSDEQGIAWTAALPGYGQSSPVVWKQRVFVTSVEGPQKQTLHVSAYALEDGKRLWLQTLEGTQGVESSDYVSKGAPTPAVDAERVYAFFESGDVAAFSQEGQPLWRRSLVNDYGPFAGNHGVGGSLALTADHVIVLVDHGGPCYLAALDKKTGETAWKTDRTQRVAWSSPMVVNDGDGARIIVSSNGTVEAFDAATGEPLWQVHGIKGNTVPSATISGDRVYVGSSDAGHNLAIRRDGEADVTQSHVLWRAERATTTFCSPLVMDGRVYMVSRSGVAYCLDARTGHELWAERVDDSCWASPLGAGDRVYFFTKSGTTVVMQAGDKPQALARNTLTVEEKSRVYGMAAVDGTLIVRTGPRLLCIRK